MFWMSFATSRLVRVLQPHFERYLQKGVVQETLEMLADGLRSGRFHFFDDLRRVFVQEHVHRFACDNEIRFL